MSKGYRFDKLSITNQPRRGDRAGEGSGRRDLSWPYTHPRYLTWLARAVVTGWVAAGPRPAPPRSDDSEEGIWPTSSSSASCPWSAGGRRRDARSRRSPRSELDRDARGGWSWRTCSLGTARLTGRETIQGPSGRPDTKDPATGDAATRGRGARRSLDFVPIFSQARWRFPLMLSHPFRDGEWFTNSAQRTRSALPAAMGGGRVTTWQHMPRRP
jgi:hypothetical protein